jgi:hypothetical protein
MKKLIQFFIGILLLQLNSFAQPNLLEKKLTVNYKQASLNAVLNDLQNRYQLQFSYTNSDIPLDKKVNLKATNQPATLVLDKIFKPLQINYVPMGNKVVLKIMSTKGKGNDFSKKEAETSFLFQTIKGVVTDKDTRQPLPGATIVARSLNLVKTALADSNGNFKLNDINIGRQELEVSMMGYQKVILQGLLVGSAKEIVLNIEMTGEAGMLEQVTVTNHRDRKRASNEMASVSARSFTVEETNRYAASISDPARMALSFPGVSSTDDLSNELVIRGNSPKGMLWRLEGIEINNPNHFSDEGSSGGGVSMISANMLDNSDFYTGAFAAEYGNALSGVFDLKFRKGNTEKNEYSFYAGVLGVGGSIEGPFKKHSKASFLINYRYSTLGLLKRVGLNPVANGAVPEYQDLAFHFNFPTKAAGTFSLFGIGGLSNQRNDAEKDQKTWDTFYDKMNTDFEYTSGSMGLKHELAVSKSSYIRSIISYSGSLVNEDMDTLDKAYIPQLFGRDRYKNQSLRASTLLNYKLNKKNLIRTGIIYNYLFFDYNSLATRRSQGIQINYLKDKGNTSLVQSYFQWRHRLANSLSFNTGIHTSWFALSKDVSIEPRLGAEWNLNNKQSISLGGGLHSRIEPLILYFAKTTLTNGTRTSNNKDLDLTKAAHLVIGYNRRITNHTKFKVEAYYQYLFDAPVVNDPSIVSASLNSTSGYFMYDYNFNTLSNKGTGKNYGIEFSVERSLNNGYYFLLNTSLYDSKFTATNGKEYNTRFNGNYITNMVGGKEWKTGFKNQNLFGLNTKVTWTGGSRYSPVNETASREKGETIYVTDKINTIRTSDYLRWDLSFTYRINKPNVTHGFFIDIQNVINRQNIAGMIYDTDKSKSEILFHAGIVPNIHYKIEF